MKCAKNLLRLWKLRHECMVLDYFAPSLMYSEKFFRHPNRMNSPKKIENIEIVCDYDFNFLQRWDWAKKFGLSSIQKCIVTFCMLAYGMKVDAIDEYCQFAKSTTMECMKWVVHAKVAIFWSKYFWKPTRAKIENQLKINENRCFPSIFTSFDYMH